MVITHGPIAGGFCQSVIYFALWRTLMKIRRKILPVTIIELTDEGLCRMANSVLTSKINLLKSHQNGSSIPPDSENIEKNCEIPSIFRVTTFLIPPGWKLPRTGVTSLPSIHQAPPAVKWQQREAAARNKKKKNERLLCIVDGGGSRLKYCCGLLTLAWPVDPMITDQTQCYLLTSRCTVVGNGFADGHGLSGFRTSRVFRE